MNTQLPEKNQTPSESSMMLAEPSNQSSAATSRHSHPIEPHPSVDVRPPEDLERCFVFGYN